MAPLSKRPIDTGETKLTRWNVVYAGIKVHLIKNVLKLQNGVPCPGQKINSEYLSFDVNYKWYFHNKSDESSSVVQFYIFRLKKCCMSNKILLTITIIKVFGLGFF